MTQLVSLVLPNMNNGPVLDEFFAKLLRHTEHPHLEVVVVDDGSTDDSREILRFWREERRFERFELIEQENAGVIHAFNRAVEASRGEIVVRLDGDATIETPGWLEKMLALHATDPQVGVVVAKIVYDTGLVHAFGRTVIAPEGLHDRGCEVLERVGRRTLDAAVHRPPAHEAPGRDELAEVDTALGCCTLFSRETFDRAGGLDPRYSPVWVEDDDFGLAVRREGQKVFFLPDVEVIHRTTRRNHRHGPGGRLPSPLRAAIGRRIPPAVRRRLGTGAQAIASEAPWRRELLQRHYAAWREKWGFDPLNPNLEAVRGRYGDTEVCWSLDPDRRAAGQEIVARYRSGLSTPLVR